jgi:hypothetical protein
MGCCLGHYTASADDLSAKPGLSRSILRTGDLVLLVEKRQSQLSVSHVAAVVYLPTLFPSDPLLLLECVEETTSPIGQPNESIQDGDPLVDKLTLEHALTGTARLVSLGARLRQLPAGSEVLLQLVQSSNAQLELKRREAGANGVAGGFNENEVLSWINNYQNVTSTNTAVGVTVDFLRYLGISESTLPKRLNINTIVQGSLIRRSHWRASTQLFSLQTQH